MKEGDDEGEGGLGRCHIEYSTASIDKIDNVRTTHHICAKNR